MNLDMLNIGLQAATLVAGALVTIYPPPNRLLKASALAVIVLCGGGGMIVANRASMEADARSRSAQDEIVRLQRQSDQRSAQMQDRLENVSKRLAAQGIEVVPEGGAKASTALATTPER